MIERDLTVRLNENVVGVLRDLGGKVEFQYLRSWLERDGAIPLSQSLPLRLEAFEHRDAIPYFAGLLPEGKLRDAVAKTLHVSPRNEFRILSKIGAECAGAVIVGDRYPGREQRHLTLNEKKLSEILQALPHQPLHTGIDDVRLSLAGAQEKLSVTMCGDAMGLPLDGSASTHILKPNIRGYEDTVANEAFCMTLAMRMGLRPATVARASAADIEYLMVTRYDRQLTADGSLERVHQEDFCQAYGIMPEHKYQSEGGPAIADLFAMLREVSRPHAPQTLRLLDMIIFNVLIGNHDAHAKNYSLLYHTHGTTEIAPLYDCLCTVVYPGLTPKMAMKIGSKYSFGMVRAQHWNAMAEASRLSSALVRKRVRELADEIPVNARAVQASFADRPIVTKIVAIIEQRCAMTMERLSS